MSIGAFFLQNQLLFHSLIIASSFIVLVKSADLLVFGINGYAKRLGLSDYLIGLLIISLTASVPELVSALTGLLAGDEGIIFGTILGSNITGITLVLGIFAILGKKIKLENKILKGMEVIVFFLILLPFFLGVDGTLTRVDGIILILVYFAYTIFLWVREAKTGHMKKNVKVKFIWKDGLIFLLALASLILSSRWMVHSSIAVSNILNINTYIMAIVVIGIAASLPDLFVGIKAIREGEVGIGIGNALGSMIVKALLFFGILAVIRPLHVDLALITIAMGTTIAMLAFIMHLTEKGSMNWKHGIFLIVAYFAYLLAEIFK